MNINAINYSIETSSLDIYVSGCNAPHCKGCHNPELISFDSGKEMLLWLDKIDTYIFNYNNLIKNIFLLGGSFNHQTDISLECFFRKTEESFKHKDIWLFAREDLKDVKNIFKDKCQYIKCGAFIPELACSSNTQYGIKLSTKNQIIYKKNIDY